MKSTTHNVSPSELLTYPCLRISARGFVVLFTKSKHGMVVGGEDTSRLGEYSTTWSMDMFARFDGSVKLESYLGS